MDDQARTSLDTARSTRAAGGSGYVALGEDPRLSRLSPELVALGLELRAFAVALVSGGRASVRTDGSTIAILESGSLLLCRGAEPLEVQARGARPAEILLFTCSLRWVELALTIAGAQSASAGDSVALHPDDAGAIELGQGLRHAWMQSQIRASPRHRLQGTASWLELLGQALDADGRSLLSEADTLDARTTRSSRHPVLPTLVDLLATGDGVPPPLVGLADQLGLSERQTSRLFRAEMGESFRAYSTRLRVGRAMKLLATTPQPVTEVALSCGWNSLSQFHTAFRRQTGTTPAAYRRTHRS